jgi:hypothetical protein
MTRALNVLKQNYATAILESASASTRSQAEQALRASQHHRLLDHHAVETGAHYLLPDDTHRLRYSPDSSLQNSLTKQKIEGLTTCSIILPLFTRA